MDTINDAWVAALVEEMNNAPLGRSEQEIAESQAIEDDAATQAFLRTFGMGTWLTRMNRRFPLRVVGGTSDVFIDPVHGDPICRA